MIKLLDREAHIGVLSHEIINPGLELQEFFRDTIALVVHPNHRWAYRKVIEPSELLEEPIIFREETSGTRHVVLSELSKYDISLDDLNIFMELGNAEAIVRTVAAGYAIAFVSTLATSCPLERGTVVHLEVQGLNLNRVIYMVRNNNSEPHRPRDVFWGFIHAPENADLIRLPEQEG
jgi:DNA-binding transcriptional LysR family regulator